jgi:hypothetical protein
MRSSLLLVLLATCLSAQTGVAPVPADPHELVTGAVTVPATPADRAAALSLLERARQNADLHIIGTPPFRIRMSFSSMGNTPYLGAGEMSEIWISGRKWRYDQQLGSYSETRVGINGRIMTQVSGTVPLRVQMLRDALFAPIFMSNSGAAIRTAAEQWNNRPVTCILISGSTDATPGRHWEETEHCIDNASGLLMIESRAPGVFSIYSYNKGLQFHGRSVPDQITIYLAGAAVVQAQMTGVEDACSTDEASVAVASGMVPAVNGSAGMNQRFPMLMSSNGQQIDRPSIVHVMIDQKGNVVEAELSAAADSSIGDVAVNEVRNNNFGPAPFPREAYINVRQYSGQ